MANDQPLRVSVVIPVFNGAESLPAVVEEFAHYTDPQSTPTGREFKVTEVILVWDRGSDASAEALRDLDARHSFVRTIWLSRNFGQHAATLAGMTSSDGDWIVTVDEDGQQDPAFVGSMLDRAFDTGSPLLYAQPTNAAPHGGLRNIASNVTKKSEIGTPPGLMPALVLNVSVGLAVGAGTPGVTPGPAGGPSGCGHSAKVNSESFLFGRHEST